MCPHACGAVAQTRSSISVCSTARVRGFCSRSAGLPAVSLRRFALRSGSISPLPAALSAATAPARWDSHARRFEMSGMDDSFELFDLRIEAVIPEGKPIYCGAKEGDYFELKGEMLSMPDGQGFSIYSISAVLPLLAAKQRPPHKNDWMNSDAELDCTAPDSGRR